MTDQIYLVASLLFLSHFRFHRRVAEAMGKRKQDRRRKKKISPTIDLSSPAPMQGKRKKTRKAAPEIIITSSCSSDDSALDNPSKKNGSRNHTNFKQQEKIDSKEFALHLEKIWTSISEDRRKSCTYLDCLWFYLYYYEKSGKSSHKTKVLMWIREKNIFSQRYVFVPIVCWHHWSLLILCHLGENLESGTPFMILLDSLGMESPNGIEPCIRKFLLDIYKSKHNEVETKLISKIPFVVPKVLQQRDGAKCGVFVLYFIKMFLQSVPEDFKVSETDAYFMKEIWHDSDGLDNFGKEIRSL